MHRARIRPEIGGSTIAKIVRISLNDTKLSEKFRRSFELDRGVRYKMTTIRICIKTERILTTIVEDLFLSKMYHMQ
jgi:hypothetical protein